MTLLPISNDLDSMIYVGFQTLITIVFTVISIHALISIFCQNNSNANMILHPLIRSIKIATICAILSYNICVIFLLLWDLFTIFGNSNSLLFGDIGISFDCMARILFQTTFIFRLTICFDGTSLALSKCSLHTLYILCIFLIIPGIGLLINYKNLRWYSAIFWLIFDLIISMRMSWLFLFKLYEVMYRSALNTLPKSCNNNNTNNIITIDNNNKKGDADKPSVLSTISINNDDDTIEACACAVVALEPVKSASASPSLEINEFAIEKKQAHAHAQKHSKNENENENENENAQIMELVSRESLRKLDLITLMTKYTLLVSISYLSTLFSVCLIFIIHKDIELIFYKHSKYIEHLIITINALICLLSLYLSYAFNNKYYQFLCKFGHKLCNNCCIDCISRKMKNDIATQQLL